MSLQVYHKILEKAEVNEFYGNEEKIRKIILGLSSGELSKEIGVSRGTVQRVFSTLDTIPAHRLRVLLRRLYEAKTPVIFKELTKSMGCSLVSLDFLKEIGILNFKHYDGQWIITETNRPIIKKYWPDIENFEEQYRKFWGGI